MEKLFNYFWLIALLTNVLNALIFWFRAQSYIQQNPALKPGYIRLIRGFLIGMSIPWIVMGIGLQTGQVATIVDYFYPRSGNQTVIAWWVSIWASLLLYIYWIWWRQGAEKLVQHPGLMRGNPTNPKTIKLGSVLILVSGLIAHGIIFLQEPR